MRVRQIPAPSRWPHRERRSLAILALDPDTIAERYGLVYDEQDDDLGRYRLAAIALADGEQAWLVKHEIDANPGTCVYVDARTDVTAALQRLLEVLAITRAELVWAAA